MFETTHFGIEVELTGITRQETAEAVAQVLRGTVRGHGGYEVVAPDRRIWKVVFDCSITA